MKTVVPSMGTQNAHGKCKGTGINTHVNTGAEPSAFRGQIQA